MNPFDSGTHVLHQGVIVEEELSFTLDGLARACGTQREWLVELVGVGLLEPRGGGPEQWRFAGPELRTARTASRLAVDLELGAAGAALVLELLCQIEALRARLQRTAGAGA